MLLTGLCSLTTAFAAFLVKSFRFEREHQTGLHNALEYASK